VETDSRWDEWLTRGRALLGVPPLSRAAKSVRGLEDPKWALGDFLLEVPPHQVERLALQLGQEKTAFRQYREVASNWPPEHRVAASWTSHRELKDHPQRFEVISPGMTVRQAAEAAGKKAIDAKPINRMSIEERASHVIAILMNKKVNDRVLTELAERREPLRIARAARAAADIRSAEYKDALRELHEAQTAKSPELAFIEVVFRLQQSTEYVRAVKAAAMDREAPLPLVPEHRKPDLIRAIENLIEVASEALKALGNEATPQPPEPVKVQPIKSHKVAKLLEPTSVSRSDQ
jgi:hypothetical protein